MATTSTLTFAEKVALPFSVAIPITIGVAGYFIWKQDKHSNETMTTRMSMWFMASCASMISLSLFHVVRNLMAASDYRIGMISMGATIIFLMCLSMGFDLLKITDDRDLLLNSRNEVTDWTLLDTQAVQTIGPELAAASGNVRRRYLVAAAVYIVMVFQSAFDGVVLKYNPNGQDSAVQVAMFFLSKVPESVVVSTALIHASIRARWYIMYMFNFTMTVGLSTIAAYGTVPPLIVIAMFEHWMFQVVLGASGGLLVTLSYYFSHMETRRADLVDPGRAMIVWNVVAFVVAFCLSAVSGMWG